ncbi:MerR family transcriptional regulator [Dictyobacter alpinus]|uniref:MerR family transcriptional regulator n=1 Tax=Dictyobacter alpinus TaxID=2014873 RepID=A0A402BEW4_9CHLR|nr:MerR family transcriptional regulator [Dictyobacter alpinus]GCE29869.1 MerR family transcriptional regulator [Dictyobacter alpinus]
MLKIGEFARLSQVSIKTLRHYDQLGLLRPSQVDPESGYRFYEVGQLKDMMRIQALKDCGLALEEIAHLLQTTDMQAVQALLAQRVEVQKQVVLEEQARLQRLLARVEQLASVEHAGQHYDVVLKQSEPLTLVGLRQSVVTTQEIGPFAWKVLHQLEAQKLVPAGPLIHLYYEECGSGEGIDLFVGASVAALPASLPGLLCERLSGEIQLACVLYRGDYTEIYAAYAALNRWLAATGYLPNGPAREIYHYSPLHSSDCTSYITEIQYPIR